MKSILTKGRFWFQNSHIWLIRYLLKEIKRCGLDCKGTFNGLPPWTDYWLVIKYPEDLILIKFKSHFSLKRENRKLPEAFLYQIEIALRQDLNFYWFSAVNIKYSPIIINGILSHWPVESNLKCSQNHLDFLLHIRQQLYENNSKKSRIKSRFFCLFSSIRKQDRKNKKT
jgi:hypothetical protein